MQEIPATIKTPKAVHVVEEPAQSFLNKVNKEPIKDISSYNISDWVAQKSKRDDAIAKPIEEQPADDFSQQTLLTEWKLFLDNLHHRAPVKFSAIKSCKLSKLDDNFILVEFSSLASKSEFIDTSRTFLPDFEKKVNNFKISFKFKQDPSLKKEIMTKKKLFDKFAKENPLLKDLNDLMKFDFS